MPERPPLSPPLATLTRGAVVIRLYERFRFLAVETDDDDEEAPEDVLRAHLANPTRREFRRVEEAETFLRSYRGEPGAMEDLRRVHAHCDRGGMLFRLSNDEIIQSLASALVIGSVIITEGAWPEYSLEGDEAGAASPPAQPDPVAAPMTPGVLAPATPAALVLDAIPEVVLPLLEEVQIAGAQVLPEILQTLEQIDLTMEQLSLAMVSLAPTPTGVPAISAGMTAASASITATLDEL